MEADLPRGLAPAVPVLSVRAAVAGTALPGRILLQHAGQGREAGRQAEPLETRAYLTFSTAAGTYPMIEPHVHKLYALDDSPTGAWAWARHEINLGDI